MLSPSSLARLAAFAISIAGTSARAQLPTEAEVRLASQHAQKGRAQFDAGHYQKAVQEFEAAYKLEPDPQLQYSIAEAQRLADADELAIAAYRRYLELAPDGADARNAHRHLRDLGAEKRVSRARPTASAPPPPPPRTEPPRTAPPPESKRPPRPATKSETRAATKSPSRADVPSAPGVDAPPPERAELTQPAPPRAPRAPLSKRNLWIIVGASAGAAAVIVLGVGLGVGLRPHETIFTDVRP